MLWIRDEFLKSRKRFEKIIVHGHTTVEQAEILPYRIGIDTGAYTTGILTCLVLQEDRQKLIQTGV
jgi:serine/threonine protein phosphatase 1